MKKFTKALLATAMSANTVMAAEVGFYAGGGLAFEAVPKYNNSGLGIVLRGGMTLDAVLENFAVEAELSKSLLDPKLASSNIKINVTSLATYAVYRIPITEKIYVKPRFGLVFPNLGDDFVNSRDITFSSGIGGGFMIKEHLDIYVDYTIIGEGITNYATGVEYHC